jgi:PHD/YefM family antitoxin component YafN of YafNO toxin-antitoxin module
MRISAKEFVRQFGRRCDEALAQPVIITRNGRDSLVVMSLAMYREPANPIDLAKPALPRRAAPLASAKPGGRKQAGNGKIRPREP